MMPYSRMGGGGPHLYTMHAPIILPKMNDCPLQIHRIHQLQAQLGVGGNKEAGWVGLFSSVRSSRASTYRTTHRHFNYITVGR